MTAKRSVKKDRAKTEDRSPPCEVAIIGMSCFFPKAGDLVAYWENILNKVDGISEVPADRWDWRDYFDPDKTARDKIYSKWGGFMDPVVFNPMTYGIPPNNLRSIDPVQLLSLEAAHRALVHAGYGNREFDRERTACIFGLAGGMGDFGLQYGFRASLPMFLEAVPEDLLSQLPEWTEDSFPGVLPNVVTGRIANCLNLGGANFTVDAACASALTAVYAGVKEILSGVSSMAIVGAADTLQNPHGFLCFSKTKALTPTGRPKPFDASADGISISEGVGALILKRKDLAVKDGDAIYAVIRGVGSSSDGRGRSLTAPQTPGQLRALANAYAMAGLSIDTVELVEAHGTGTVVGDGTEAESMAHALAEAGAPSKGCAVGSVKSNIGHTKGCAGIAGLIKATLSLHHKVLPATLHVNQPGAKAFLDEASPVYVNTENRPWISRYPVRRAGVNSFGFGGTNFHVVLEEFVPATPGTGTFPLSTWPCELFVWKGDTAGQIDSRLAILEKGFAASTSAPRLRDLARHVYENRGKGKLALTIVAESVDDLKAKLADARAALKRGEALSDPRGIYFHPEPLGKAGKVAFLFPGQGSQRPDMMRDLAILFPELRDRFARADGLLAERLEKRLSDYVYPPPRFSAEAEKAAMKAITETNIAQPSLGVTEIGMCRILETLGVKPDMAAGHSSGEYTALCAAGVFGEDTLFEILEDRGASILASAKGDLGTMMAVRADRSQTEAVLKAFPNVYVANFNSPSQTIISGLQANLEQAGAAFQEKGIQARLIPVSCAFHSPIIEPARDYLAAKLKVLAYEKPNIPVYANLSAAPYPEDRETILHLLTDHLIGCVRFVEQIERMYADGARVFVEVGPGTVLTNLVGQILAGQPHHAVATEAKSPRHDLFMLLNALGQLAAQGVEVFLDRLFEGRETRTLKVENLDPMEPASALSPVAWKVAPDRAWPWREAKPTRRKLDLRPAEDIQRLAAEAAPSGGMPGPAAGGGGSPLADVLVQHQQTMSEFLRQQREVMMAYLRGEAGAMQAVPAPVSTPRAIPAPVAPKAAVAPAAPAPVPAAPVGPSQQAGGHKERLLALVAERTGYPVDMIDPNASIEADLGIDSIKRLEILIAFAKDLPGAPEDLPEQLNTSTTLAEVLAKAAPFTGGAVAKAAPAAPAPAMSAPAQVAGGGGGDHEARLLQLVAERTGYPVEMLDLNAGIESDLGIDSIKRLEILIAFAKDLPGAPEDLPEQLNTSTTLGEVLRKAGQLAGGGGAAVPAPAGAVDVVSSPGSGGIQRGIPRLVEAPLPEASWQPVNGVVVITDDGNGVAKGLAKLLTQAGQASVILSDRASTPSGEEPQVILSDSGSVRAVLDHIRKDHGEIGGIVHLRPVSDAPGVADLDPSGWREQTGAEVKGLFYLLRYAAGDLQSDGLKVAVAGTRLGGTGQGEELGCPDAPWRGGVMGLMKCVADEWPETRCRAVDVSGLSAKAAAEALFRELSVSDGVKEAYHRDGKRYRVDLVTVPVDPSAGGVELSQEDVVLVLGGARGITALVAQRLAEMVQPTLILAGRSPWPEAESPGTAGQATAAEIKKVLFKQATDRGEKPKPVEIEKVCQRILNDRAMRASVEAMKAAGARVEYVSVDVTDEAGVAGLIANVRKRYGRLDGVINGAGIIEDKLLGDKSPSSFDRVFDNKAMSVHLLSRLLDPASLKFLVLFSSIAGWYGNRGQSDYAAANEVFNRMAQTLAGLWPGRVVAVGWGPWDQTGMASDEVKRQFRERGVGLVQPESGVRYMIDELRHGSRGDALVVVEGELD